LLAGSPARYLDFVAVFIEEKISIKKAQSSKILNCLAPKHMIN
jgi:hypothetical protein